MSSIAHRGFVHLGMDVAKDSIAVAGVAQTGGRQDPNRPVGAQTTGQAKGIWACYEAGRRVMTSNACSLVGVRCDVVAPSLIPGLGRSGQDRPPRETTGRYAR